MAFICTLLSASFVISSCFGSTIQPVFLPAINHHKTVVPNYAFGYGVYDEKTANNFGHKETRNGDRTEGAYYVHLPDGRLQKVTYYVDAKSGFVANVEYVEPGANTPFHTLQQEKSQSQPAVNYEANAIRTDYNDYDSNLRDYNPGIQTIVEASSGTATGPKISDYDDYSEITSNHDHQLNHVGSSYVINHQQFPGTPLDDWSSKRHLVNPDNGKRNTNALYNSINEESSTKPSDNGNTDYHSLLSTNVDKNPFQTSLRNGKLNSLPFQTPYRNDAAIYLKGNPFLGTREYKQRNINHGGRQLVPTSENTRPKLTSSRINDNKEQKNIYSTKFRSDLGKYRAKDPWKLNFHRKEILMGRQGLSGKKAKQIITHGAHQNRGRDDRVINLQMEIKDANQQGDFVNQNNNNDNKKDSNNNKVTTTTGIEGEKTQPNIIDEGQAGVAKAASPPPSTEPRAKQGEGETILTELSESKLNELLNKEIENNLNILGIGQNNSPSSSSSISSNTGVPLSQVSPIVQSRLKQRQSLTDSPAIRKLLSRASFIQKRNTIRPPFISSRMGKSLLGNELITRVSSRKMSQRSKRIDEIRRLLHQLV